MAYYNLKNNSKFKLSKAMSMIEILVVIGLTSMLLIGAMSMLSSAIRVQSETLARQSMIDQASYVLDIMTKELRMARKDYDNDCGIIMPNQDPTDPTATSAIYMIPEDKSGIRFYSQQEGTCLEFRYDAPSSTILMGAFQTSSVADGPLGNSLYNPYNDNEVSDYLRLISDDIKVEKFSLDVYGQTKNQQPMVTISMILKHKIKTQLAPVHIQTTISSRNLNWSAK